MFSTFLQDTQYVQTSRSCQEWRHDIRRCRGKRETRVWLTGRPCRAHLSEGLQVHALDELALCEGARKILLVSKNLRKIMNAARMLK